MTRPLPSHSHSLHGKRTRPWARRQPQGHAPLGCGRPRPTAADLTLAEARERQRVAQGLHDHIGPLLTLAGMRLDAVEASTGRSMTEVRDLVRQALKEVRSLTFDLRAPLLESHGLSAALEDLGRRWQAQHGLECEVTAADFPLGLTEAWNVFLLRATRELLWNIVKHADACRVVVSLQHRAGIVELRVDDDGDGFKESHFGKAQPSLHTTSQGGLGLPELRRRAEQLGGQLHIATSKQGTRVQISVPTEAAATAWPAAV